MCKINCSGGCPDCDDPYAVFKQAIKDGKRIQFLMSRCPESWIVGNWNFNNDVHLYRIHPDDVDKSFPIQEKKPHKHAALIKAWADGALIEFESPLTKGIWYSCTKFPEWSLDREYRIKPEPKPDVVVTAVMDFKHDWKTPSVRVSWNGECPAGYRHHIGQHIRFVFDGETGMLKKVETI